MENETPNRSSILAWNILWIAEPGVIVHGVTKSWTQLRTYTEKLTKLKETLTSAYQFIKGCNKGGASLVAQMVKNLPAKQRLWINPRVQMIP